MVNQFTKKELEQWEFDLKIESMLLDKSIMTLEGHWLWTGRISNKGYGIIQYYLTKGKRKHLGTHREAARLWLKNFDESLDVCHKCDIPLCFNPEHLFVGTTSDNFKDAVMKGRQNNIKKTVCKNGHEFTGKFTYKGTTRRFCRICNNKWARDKYKADKVK